MVSGIVADVRGARASNTGDQFHELWALEQTLALLDRTTRLDAVTVEGIPAEPPGAAEGGPQGDGVDCALFFRGTSLENVRRVEIVQLKYSSDPDKFWSIARLTASSAKKGNNSVLRRPAAAFKAARAAMQPAAGLRLRLVSNQPVDDEVRAAFGAVAGGRSSRDALGQQLVLVTKATGLSAAELPDFLAALDFSECGRESRFAQRERVTLSVASLLEDNAISDVAELRQRVRELMLPERSHDVVTFKTVLSWFGIHDELGLFPCPSQIVKAEKAITRGVTHPSGSSWLPNRNAHE